MTHFYEKNIVDIKKEYTEYLLNILTPLLYEGFNSIYSKARITDQSFNEACKKDPNLKNPGIIAIFQHFVSGIPKLNDHLIEEETKRIRDNSRCANFFDDLIKAVIKSNIILLTYNSSGKKCKLVEEKFHQNMDIKAFVHKCYVECSRIFYDHALLFWHELPPNDLKYNKQIIYQLVKHGIKNAIRHTLPMKLILEEYLKNDYIVEANEEDQMNNKFIKIKDMLNRDIYQDQDQDEGGIRKIIVTSESPINSIHENINKLEENVDNLTDLIFDRQMVESYDTANTNNLKSVEPINNMPSVLEQNNTNLEPISNEILKENPNENTKLDQNIQKENIQKNMIGGENQDYDVYFLPEKGKRKNMNDIVIDEAIRYANESNANKKNANNQNTNNQNTNENKTNDQNTKDINEKNVFQGSMKPEIDEEPTINIVRSRSQIDRNDDSYYDDGISNRIG